MSSSPTLTLNGQSWSLNELAACAIPETATPFERETIAFYQAWLKGQEAFFMYTSGSTGLPKPVTFTREQMKQSALLTERALNLRPGMTALLCLDPAYIAGKMMIVRSLVTGMNLVAVEPRADPLKDLPGNFDFSAMVPYQVKTLLKSGVDDLNRVAILLVGGGPVEEATRSALRNCSSAVYATFGMTETVSHVALQRLNGLYPALSFSGLKGIGFSTDSRGCLVINAPHLDELVVTNDVVDLISPNRFVWKGRWDNVINIKGFKIFPEELEARVRTLASIPLPAFVVTKVKGTEDTLFAIFEGPPLSGEQEKSFLRCFEKPFERPAKIFYVDRLPRTKTGKVNRFQLNQDSKFNVKD